jgi:uncharacterized protein YdeI (YjbR/CyaY-like superfamily)
MKGRSGAATAAAAAGKLAGLLRVQVVSRTELREWLTEHHTSSTGIWLVTFKKQHAERYVPYGDVVEELLCFGWVDGRAARLDAERTMRLATPRRPSSAWSRPNKERVARLEADGLMTERGLEAIAVARANGRWDALNKSDALTMPVDLDEALAAVGPAARRHWDAFPASARRAILEWIEQAKRSETRRKRVEETARLAAVNKRANQWPRTSVS